MRVHKNRVIGNAGVNAVKTLFEAERCVVQLVADENDYGKDAYVDHAASGEVTGFCVAVQIKSGAKYQRETGYAIPVESHERVWRDSSLPVAGIVHDAAKGLFWVNITRYLKDHAGEKVTSIPVPTSNELTAHTLHTAFWSGMQSPGLASNPLLGLVGSEGAGKRSALLDCFACGRSDARHLLALRYLLRALEDHSLRIAIQILSFATPHPDIAWSNSNWLPQPIREAVRASFTWSEDEVLQLIASAPYEEWQRGLPGQNAFYLLVQDESILAKAERVVSRAFDLDHDAGSTAVAFVLHLAGEKGPAAYKRMARRDPRVRTMGGADEVERILVEFGEVSLF